MKRSNHILLAVAIGTCTLVETAFGGLRTSDGETQTGKDQAAESLRENAEEWAEKLGMTVEEVLALADSMDSSPDQSLSSSADSMGFASMDETDEYSWYKSIGTSSLGADLGLRAGYWNSSEKKGVYADAAANAYVLGSKWEVIGLSAYSFNTPSNAESHYEIIWMDEVVDQGDFEETFTPQPFDLQIEKEWQWQFTIGPVPVIIEVALGFEFELTADITLSATGAGVGAGLHARAYGEVSAAVGGEIKIAGKTILGAKAGVRGTIHLFDVSFDGSLIVSMVGSPDGAGFTLEVEALEVSVEVYAWVSFLGLEKEWDAVVWEWELAAYAVTWLDGELEVEDEVDNPKGERWILVGQ